MEPEQADGSKGTEGCSDERRIVVCQSQCDRQASRSCSYGISKVESGLYAASSEHFSSRGVLYDEELLWCADGEKASADEEHHGDGQ